MPQLMLLTLLAATAAQAEVRVATMTFTTRGVPKELGTIYTERFAAALRDAGVTVTTEKDLVSVLSVERQAQLLGCAESSSTCLTELAGALGAPFVISGSISRIGTVVTLSLRVLEVSKSRSVFTLSSELPSAEKVLDALVQAAPEVAARLRDAGVTASGSSELIRSRGAPTFTAPWVAIALGALGGGGGAGLLVAAQVIAAPLYGTPTMELGPDAAMQIAARTGPLRTAGWVTVGVSAAVLVAGVVWRVVAGSSVSVALVPSRDGAAFALGASW